MLRNQRIPVVAPLAGAWIEILGVGYGEYKHVSLPSRERGLKLSQLQTDYNEVLSLPSRERGLKYACYNFVQVLYWSLPSRERGLKYHDRTTIRKSNIVAPLAGAWIEISSNPQLYL